MEDEPTITTKSAASLFGNMERFSIDEKSKDETFGEYVQLTAKLIKRPYMVAFGMMKTWPTEQIIRHYELATKHSGDMPSDVYWWWLRKKLRQK